MWIAFGFVSLALVFGYRLWRKWYWAWGWTDDHGYLKCLGKPYKVRTGRKDKKAQVVSFAVECSTGFNFRIKRETRVDRWAKAIGLSWERQVGDQDFDSQLYIVSNDPVWCDELTNRQELRRVIKALFADRRLGVLTCEGCHLWVDESISGADIPEDLLRGHQRDNIVAALHSIADVLGGISESATEGKVRDPFALKAVALVSLSSALLIVGLLEWFRIEWVERGQIMIDAAGLFGFSTMAGAVLLFVGLLTSAALLRGSSHAHVVMLEVLVSGGIGLLLVSYVFARDVNCSMDTTVSKPYYVTVNGKHQGYRRRYGTYYTLTLDGSVMNQGLPRSLEVPFSAYQKAEVGKQLLFNIKSGFLGYRWIESIQ